jgi:hypothetical protein
LVSIVEKSGVESGGEEEDAAVAVAVDAVDAEEEAGRVLDRGCGG